MRRLSLSNILLVVIALLVEGTIAMLIFFTEQYYALISISVAMVLFLAWWQSMDKIKFENNTLPKPYLGIKNRVLLIKLLVFLVMVWLVFIQLVLLELFGFVEGGFIARFLLPSIVFIPIIITIVVRLKAKELKEIESK